MKSFNPSKYGDFTRGEIIFVIQRSSALQSIEEIKEDFAKFTSFKKAINGDQILNIQADFSSTIAKKTETYLKNIKGNPMSHPRIIFDMCLEIYKESRKKVPSHTIKVSDQGPGMYEKVEKEDLKTALAAVKLAKDFVMELEKLSLEKEKSPKISTPESISNWVVDDGFSIDE